MRPAKQLSDARWRVVVFLTCAAALNYADRSALSVVLPTLSDEFDLTDVQLGLLGSVFLWGYALGSPFAGILADRMSRRALVVGSLALWSGVTALMGFANGIVALVFLRLGLGLAESLYLPAATALIADCHSPETRGRAMSIHSLGLNFGVVLGGASVGYLADHFGWRVGLAALGVVGIGLALSARFVVPSVSPTGTGGAHVLAARASFAEAARYLLGVPSFHALLAKAMLAGVGIWVFLNWLPLYFGEAFDMSLGAAGFAGAFMLQISTMLGIAFGGWISDRAAARGAQRRMIVQGLCYLVAAPFLLLFLARPGFVVVAVAVSFFSFFRGMGQASESPTLCDVIPACYRSTAIGIMNTFATAAGGVGVLFAGGLKERLGLDAIFAAISLLFAIAGITLVVAYRCWIVRDIDRAAGDSDRQSPAT